MSIFATAKHAVRRHGPAGAISRIPSAVASRAHIVRRQFRDWRFDRSEEVFTGGLASPTDYPLNAIGSEHATKYQGIDPSCFYKLVSYVPPPCSDWLFLDLGAGRGRALMLAVRSGFRDVIGVELSETLAEDARRNCTHMSSSKIPTIVTADAVDYPIPDESVFIFLYNPFSEHILRAVARNISLRNERSAARLLVGYAGPQSVLRQHEPILCEVAALERVCRGREWSLYQRAVG